ncbi:MAG: hypothetical protein EA365_13905 [Gloeocapsa sp. DLM2.Bin57]|nr:MAG: hypothetical protein EA365_13905 [Gloeocapsa sp. DLM2.Bin57]
MQSVPTGMTIAPDNSIYITNLIDVAFDSNSNLYALEYASNVLPGDLTGNLWRIDTNGTKTRINIQGLQFPTGLAITENDTIYIANNGFATGVGEIIELQPSNVIPEPSLLLSSVLLNLGFLGYMFKFKR